MEEDYIDMLRVCKNTPFELFVLYYRTKSMNRYELRCGGIVEMPQNLAEFVADSKMKNAVIF